MNRLRFTWCLAILLVCFIFPVSAVSGLQDEHTRVAQTDKTISSIHEVEILVVRGKGMIHVAGDQDAVPIAITGKGPDAALEARHAAILHPLLSNLTLTNTEAKLIQSMRRELHAIGVKVTRVRIKPYSGCSECNSAVLDVAGEAPRTIARLVISLNIFMSMDFRTGGLSVIAGLVPRNSTTLISSTNFGESTRTLNGADPAQQWAAGGAKQFLDELGLVEKDLGKAVVDSLFHKDKPVNPPPPPRVDPEEMASLSSEHKLLDGLEVALADHQDTQILFAGPCVRDDFGHLLIPPIDIQSPEKKGGGLEAVRDMFRNDPSVSVSEDQLGRITIKIGQMSATVLDTKINLLLLNQNAQYNINGPDNAIESIEETPEFEAAAARLKLHQVGYAYVGLQAPPIENQPHLPPSIRNKTVGSIFDLIAKTFRGIPIYGECQEDDGKKLLDIEFYRFPTEDMRSHK